MSITHKPQSADFIFEFTSDQTLCELRDAIVCGMDYSSEEAKSRIHSGYFLIERRFYNDMRHPSAIDYSTYVIHFTFIFCYCSLNFFFLI